MDFNPGTIIYILAMLVYFIVSANRKKKKQQANQPPRSQGQPQTSSRKPTFEELLEEITGQKFQKEEEVYKPVSQKEEPPVFSYENEVDESPAEKSYFTFEDQSSDKFKTLDEQIVIDEVKTTSDLSVKKTGLDMEEENHYGKLLNNPGSLRDAIILKEILDRKHF